MLHFKIDEDKCTGCELCVRVCPIRIVDMDAGYPRITSENEAACLHCQHCLAICPTAALSILGRKPENSMPLEGAFPDPDRLEILIKGRRSVRCFEDENLEPLVLRRLLDAAWHAPTGANDRRIRFTVIDDKEVMISFRREVYVGLAERINAGGLPGDKAFFAEYVRLWQEENADPLFRGAPHFLAASAPRDSTTPVPDCLIALSYFELFAQSMGIGTLWDGLAKWAVDDLVPKLRERLSIPRDHVLGYTMVFGKPAVRYRRTVERGPADWVRVSL